MAGAGDTDMASTISSASSYWALSDGGLPLYDNESSLCTAPLVVLNLGEDEAEDITSIENQ